MEKLKGSPGVRIMVLWIGGVAEPEVEAVGLGEDEGTPVGLVTTLDERALAEDGFTTWVAEDPAPSLPGITTFPRVEKETGPVKLPVPTGMVNWVGMDTPPVAWETMGELPERDDAREIAEPGLEAEAGGPDAETEPEPGVGTTVEPAPDPDTEAGRVPEPETDETAEPETELGRTAELAPDTEADAGRVPEPDTETADPEMEPDPGTNPELAPDTEADAGRVPELPTSGDDEPGTSPRVERLGGAGDEDDEREAAELGPEAITEPEPLAWLLRLKGAEDEVATETTIALEEDPLRPELAVPAMPLAPLDALIRVGSMRPLELALQESAAG